jgi:3-polyprenyl-4-hydroxybenzoate decarboxylase
MSNFEDIIIANSFLSMDEIKEKIHELDEDVSIFLTKYMLLTLASNIDPANKVTVIQNTNLLALCLLQYLHKKPFNLHPSLN